MAAARLAPSSTSPSLGRVRPGVLIAIPQRRSRPPRHPDALPRAPGDEIGRLTKRGIGCFFWGVGVGGGGGWQPGCVEWHGLLT